MAAGDKEGAEEIKKQIGTLGSDLEAKKVQLAEIQNKLEYITLSVPNLPDDEVPAGKDENDNVEVSRWGEPKSYDFEVKDHVDLGEMGSGLDFLPAQQKLLAHVYSNEGAICASSPRYRPVYA